MATRSNAGTRPLVNGRGGPPPQRATIGTFSVLLGIVLLLMLGGLVVADQALRRSGEGQARIDANESAVVLVQLLQDQLEELDDFGLFSRVGSRGVGASDLTRMASGFARDRAVVRHLWIADSAGTLVFDSTFVRTPGAAGRASDGAYAGVLRVVLRTGRPAIAVGSRIGSSRELFLGAPTIYGGHVIGAVGAVYDARTLLGPVLRLESDARDWVAITTGADTIVSIGVSPAPAKRSAADVLVPSGARWRIEVSHVRPGQSLRLTLWILAIIAVVFLSIGVYRERRQAMRIAERSAELERLSTELLRANRMKSEFLANVSHELRTPLNAIVGFVDLLRDGVYGDLTPRQTPPVDRIAASATHLRHLVDQVLDIAKIAAGRLEVHSEPIALRPFVLNVASELESLISERGLNLSIAVGASLPRVRTDPGHLRQILVNLIGNAVKYTKAGGVAVRARLAGATRMVGGRRISPEDPTLIERAPEPKGAWIALQVIDTGIGIAPVDQDRIFDEFEQVNAGPRGDSIQRGTGLGLAISRRLARLLGGDITVESQPGKGSTFTVWLPVSSADLDQTETRPADRAAPAGKA